MLLPLDTPQGIADTLGYLQYYLQELMERQHVSENNINTTLVALSPDCTATIAYTVSG